MHERVIDHLFGEQFHPELARRAGVIIEFLAENSSICGFGQDHVEKIVGSLKNKHEADTQAIYEALKESLPGFFHDSGELSLFLCRQLSETVDLESASDSYKEIIEHFANQIVQKKRSSRGNHMRSLPSPCPWCAIIASTINSLDETQIAFCDANPHLLTLFLAQRKARTKTRCRSLSRQFGESSMGVVTNEPQ